MKVFRSLSAAFVCSTLAALAACGGGSQAPTELSIDGPESQTTSSSIITLNGSTFIPSGSSCPASNDFVVIGAFGPHSIAWSNDKTGQSGVERLGIWVCNSEHEKERAGWTIYFIRLDPGTNHITVTMTDSVRSSTDSVTVIRN